MSLQRGLKQSDAMHFVVHMCLLAAKMANFQKRLRSRIDPNCTLSQNGYGDISGRKRCQVIVRSMQFDNGQCDAVGKKTKRDKSWQHFGLPKRSPTSVLTRPWLFTFSGRKRSGAFNPVWPQCPNMGPHPIKRSSGFHFRPLSTSPPSGVLHCVSSCACLQAMPTLQCPNMGPHPRVHASLQKRGKHCIKRSSGFHFRPWSTSPPSSVCFIVCLHAVHA